ncbi:protein NUCLEAR FUSION DEFECTIVE [Trifolium repens]|nr:protein NUCLEAR FUSION DEFECTIVE [Trifolium repens]
MESGSNQSIRRDDTHSHIFFGARNPPETIRVHFQELKSSYSRHDLRFVLPREQQRFQHYGCTIIETTVSSYAVVVRVSPKTNSSSTVVHFTPIPEISSVPTIVEVSRSQT